MPTVTVDADTVCGLWQVCVNRCLDRGKTSGRTDDNMESLKKRQENTSSFLVFHLRNLHMYIFKPVRVKSQQPVLHIVDCCCRLSVPPDEHQSKTQTDAFLTRWTSPKGGRVCLMSFSCLESQGCHSLSLSYLLSCSSTWSCCFFCFAVFRLILLPFFQKILQSFLLEIGFLHGSC